MTGKRYPASNNKIIVALFLQNVVASWLSI